MYLYLQIFFAKIIGLIRGLWFLLQYRCWALTGTPIGYPVVALCHGNFAVLGLLDWLLHMLLQIIDEVDIELKPVSEPG